ncbi:hypothetical protein [Nocardia sp. NBC_01009]|uniref:hypothetical protein n=1 Tax=Nocardia sp. NBC_01009 TaxID=2975996 RepID=UPI003866325D|nr:hypothetical protein OHA42_25475 [Nocardia sp. NBC_01009]
MNRRNGLPAPSMPIVKPSSISEHETDLRRELRRREQYHRELLAEAIQRVARRTWLRSSNSEGLPGFFAPGDEVPSGRCRSAL